MSRPDFNLLVTLDAVLTEGSVARAAKRLRLSPSAMSRALARLRETTGDPLLVRSGRGLVPTPRALELREKVGDLVQEVEAILRPQEKIDLARLSQTFTVRSSDGFVENFGPALIARVSAEAPGVQLRFVQKTYRDNSPLRDGTVDLETGIVSEATAPEFRTQALFRDRFVGVVRKGHPLTKVKITTARYVKGEHVDTSQHVGPPGTNTGPIDMALDALNHMRHIVVVVGGFSSALTLARTSNLIATVPERHTENLRAGMHSFSLPFPSPKITVAMLWHPRLDADPAHRWLRGCVRETCSG